MTLYKWDMKKVVFAMGDPVLYLVRHRALQPYYRVYLHSTLNAKILAFYLVNRFCLLKYLVLRLLEYKLNNKIIEIFD